MKNCCIIAPFVCVLVILITIILCFNRIPTHTCEVQENHEYILGKILEEKALQIDLDIPAYWIGIFLYRDSIDLTSWFGNVNLKPKLSFIDTSLTKHFYHHETFRRCKTTSLDELYDGEFKNYVDSNEIGFVISCPIISGSIVGSIFSLSSETNQREVPVKLTHLLSDTAIVAKVLINEHKVCY